MKEEDFSFKRESIFCTARAGRTTEKEQYVPSHVLIHVLAGRLSVVEANSTHSFKQGDTLFIRRNTLAKFTKYPEENGAPFKTLSIFLRKAFLQKYLPHENIVSGTANDHADMLCRVKKLWPSALMDNIFESLRLYFDSGRKLGGELSEIKTREILLVLKQIDRRLFESLFHFAAPEKIDLEDFMSKNFVFNVPLEAFSKMTGRSLSTFKRDFKRVFADAPSRWLKKKRLEHAYYLIKEKNKAPSDVYLEVGFENLSHFSSSFKEVFGRNPSSLNDPHNKVNLTFER